MPIRVFVLLSLAAVCFCCPALAQTPVATHTPAAKFHPILKFSKAADLDVDSLDPSVYKKLNDIYGTVWWEKYCSDDIYQGELKVCEHLCKILPGMTEHQVENLIGKPEITCGQIECWPDSTAGEENWIYNFGYLHVNVLAVFREHTCVRAEVFYKERHSAFTRWWTERIEKFAPGKTEAEIVAFAGQPMSRELRLPTIGWQELKDADFILTYEVKFGSGVYLGFKGGKCYMAKSFITLQ